MVPIFAKLILGTGIQYFLALFMLETLLLGGLVLQLDLLLRVRWWLMPSLALAVGAALAAVAAF
jgi:hypothetical protein